ncbi:MAG TPA: hypothetical protein VGD14_11755 [bacterium]
MKKIYIIVILFLISSQLMAESPSFVNPKRFTSEFQFGLRTPTGENRNDISTGFALKFGVGYQLTKHLEIFHLAFDFGSSSPERPDWAQVYDPTTGYYTLEQETVNIYGFPLTVRWRSQIKQQLEIYLGAGAAYYWFSTRLADPYYGDLKKSRKCHGPGGVLEAGLFTDAFSEKLLVGLTANFTYLKTEGKSLTEPEPNTPDERIDRKDSYLTFAITLRYFMGR